MECISTATTSALVNDSLTEKFSFKRELYHGDTLSYFLLLIAAKCLNVTMQASVDTRLYSHYKVGNPYSVSILHIQFVDETLLICVKIWASMEDVLILFEVIPGSKVNFHKSWLVGVNVSTTWLTETSALLSCKMGTLPFSYLGLQLVVILKN